MTPPPRHGREPRPRALPQPSQGTPRPPRAAWLPCCHPPPVRAPLFRVGVMLLQGHRGEQGGGSGPLHLVTRCRHPAPQMQESRAPHPGFSVPRRRRAECLPWGPPARRRWSADGCRTPALHGLQTRFGRRGPRGEHAGAPRWLQALGQGATCQTRCLPTGPSAGPAAR